MNPRKGPPRHRSPRPARRAQSGRDRASARRRADESGGAVSLWVVLMVPVSAFAAVVAMAGPQRMAAESSMDEAAEDLAMLAVAWRDGHHNPDGPLPAFPPGCEASPSWLEALARLDAAYDEQDDIVNDPERPPEERSTAETARAGARAKRDTEVARQDTWTEACDKLFEWIVRDLGNLGVDVNSLRGFYSDSLTSADSLVNTGQQALPCKISERVEVRDAVHVALAADWLYAGWAAAQVWPDGTRMGAESIGRLRRNVTDSTTTEQCGKQLDVLDSQGRAVVLTEPDPVSRQLSQLVPGRTVIEG